jgi:antitoxin FitA
MGRLVASVTIRNLDESVKRKLRLRAAQRNRSMEDEARDILRTALAQEPTQHGNLADAIRRRIEPLRGCRSAASGSRPAARPARLCMIILDTNVLSETLRPTPSAADSRALQVKRLGRKILDFRQLLVLGKILERGQYRQ